MQTLDLKAAEVLGYWFGELDKGFPKTSRTELWFAGGREAGRIDKEIRQRFASLYLKAVEGSCAGWAVSPRGRLALIILLDQFSRNIYRGQAEAFAADDLALHHAKMCLLEGQDLRLAPIERVFCYLPFEHSERLSDQEQSVELFNQLLLETDEPHQAQVEHYCQHAREHRDVIARFSRFPHRNQALERTSTAEELAYLETATGYGQSSQPKTPPLSS